MSHTRRNGRRRLLSGRRIVSAVVSTVASLVVPGLVVWLFSCTVMNGLSVTVAGDGSVSKRAKGTTGGDDDDTVADGGDPDGGPGGGTQCDYAAPFTIFEPLTELNTAADEELPRLTRDELSIYYFNDDLPDGGSLMHHAARTSISAPFGAPETFFPQLAGARQAFPSGDPLRLYYAQGDEQFNLHIALRATANDAFAPGRVVLSAAANQSLAYPALFDAPTGTRMFLISTTSDGDNDHSDIWSADVDPTGTVLNPSAQAGVNTPDMEFDPTPSVDGLALYFYSDHTLVSDRGRIWFAQRSSADQPFGTPKIVTELAPPAEGYISPAFLSVDRCRLYYYQATASDGPSDLFVATRSP